MNFNDIEETNEDIDEEFNMDNNDNYLGWILKDRLDSHSVVSFNVIKGIVEFVYDGNYFNDMISTWKPEFYYYGNRETWPQHEGPHTYSGSFDVHDPDGSPTTHPNL
jgi:hypothetical protein